MPESIKVGVIGGDRRASVVAKRLARRFECAAWGFDTIPDDCVKCADLASAVRGADAIVLPLPSSRGGMLNSVPAVPLNDICAYLKPSALVFGGMIPADFTEAVRERGASVFDYYESEGVQIKNSVPTAEGAVAAIISEMPVTIAGMRIVVTGYGRCARALVRRLILLGAEVYVTARSERDRAWAEADGAAAVPLGEYLRLPIECDAIVNTVPVRLFDGGVVGRLDEKTVIFDISGGCVGVDTDAADGCGIKVVPLPALPGKTSPETAGAIIAVEIENQLTEHLTRGGVLL